MSKEASALIIDVGAAMITPAADGAPALEHAILCAKHYLQQKLLFTKRDEMTVVLVGSDNTRSELNPDGTGPDYKHIETLIPVSLPRVDWLDRLSSLQTTDGAGDLMDGLAVAVYNIASRVKKLKFSRRIFLLTNAATPIDMSLADSLVATLVEGGYALNVIGIGFSDVDSSSPDPEDAEAVAAAAAAAAAGMPEPWAEEILSNDADTRPREQKENEIALRRFVARADGVVLPVEMAFQRLSAMQKKEVSQVSKMRGFMDFGDIIKEKICVVSYTLTSETAFLSRKSQSLLSAAAAEDAAAAAAGGAGDDEDGDVQLPGSAGAVSLVRRYYRPAGEVATDGSTGARPAGGSGGNDDDDDDDDGDDGARVKREAGVVKMESGSTEEDGVDIFNGVEVDALSRGKAYRYGADTIPFDDASAAALKPVTERGLTIIRSVARTQVLPSLLMSPADYIAAEPGNKGAALAMDALVHGLVLTDCVLLCRYIKRANSPPEFGALFPYISADNTCGLHYTRLPFDEDIRTYSFAPFSTYPEHVPDSRQLAAADRLIQSMSLATLDSDGGLVGEELHAPADVRNPSLARLYASLHTRALDPSAPIEPCEADDPVLAGLSLDPTVAAESAPARARFAALLPVTRAEDVADEQGRRKHVRRHWRDVQADALARTAANEEAGKAEYEVKVAEVAAAAGRDGAGLGASVGAVLGLGVRMGLGGSSNSVKKAASVAAAGTVIGTGDPVGDLRVALSRARASAAAVDALEGVLNDAGEMVLSLIDRSAGDALLPKAVALARALRDESVSAGTGAGYNGMLTRLAARAASDPARWGGAWEDIKARGNTATLISDQEVATGGVSVEKAAAFFTEGAVEVAPAPVEAAPVTAAQDDFDFDALE